MIDEKLLEAYVQTPEFRFYNQPWFGQFRAQEDGSIDCELDGSAFVPLEEFHAFHRRCNDCGQFLRRAMWVPKDHRWKQHALCGDCLSNYD